MRKLSLTDALAALAAVAGLVAAGGFAVSNTALGGAALGVGVVLCAILIGVMARGARRRHHELLTVVSDGGARIARLEESAETLAGKADLILRAHRKSVKVAINQGDRIEERTESMTRRILSDLSASRLEAADRQAAHVD